MNLLLKGIINKQTKFLLIINRQSMYDLTNKWKTIQCLIR
jgi:hypothetical protein